MNGPQRPLRAYGMELEYMIVDARTLDVLPVADGLIRSVAGEYVNEVEFGPMAWSNELAAHVVEVKNLAPAPELSSLLPLFEKEVKRIEEALSPFGAMLLPTGMHPWMDPMRETRLWPHGNREIYETYNRIFSCSGHGWANVQSAHLNLGFAGDEEFARLHAAVRILLPILPAIAASSPVVEGRATGLLDTRLEYYRNNQKRVPSVTGQIIPERVYSRRDYENVILARNYADIAPFDPAGILRHEWLNSRGAIARFERSAIEIRVLDVQECPLADFAVAAMISAVLEACVAETWAGFEEQAAQEVGPLAAILLDVIRKGEAAVIEDEGYLALFGFPGKRAAAAELWRHLAGAAVPGFPDPGDERHAAMERILAEGPLARRILRALGGDFSKGSLYRVYQGLSDCLRKGCIFPASG
ncbi:MAG: glutamate--cysteine ligase [Deltaproteobacteria bacterium]